MPEIESKYFSSNRLLAYRRLPFRTTYGHFGWFSSSRTAFSPHPVYAIISETFKRAFSHNFIFCIHSLFLLFISKIACIILLSYIHRFQSYSNGTSSSSLIFKNSFPVARYFKSSKSIYSFPANSKVLYSPFTL